MNASDPLLSIDSYSLSYATAQGTLKVLDEIDLTIARGEVVGLVGESGSGKSSLAYAIMRGLPGQVSQERGAICFDGSNNNLLELGEKQLEKIRGNRIAMVFQNAATALNPTQTLGEHVIEVLCRHRGLEPSAAREHTIDLFAKVGLADAEALLSRYAHEISGGEKQRVVLATAFACDPDLILFDEPTSALDATTAASLLDMLRELQAVSGVAALFISHDLGVIAAIAHRVAVIYAGRIIEQSPAKPLFREPYHPYTQALLDSVPKPAQSADPVNLRVIEEVAAANLDGPGSACVYATRCPLSAPPCQRQAVPLQAVDDQRQVACLRWQESLERPRPSAYAVAEIGASEEPVLQADSIAVEFGRTAFLSGLFGGRSNRVYAVNDVNIRLHRGETLGLVGESGCGKSSFARALVGLTRFTGHIVLDGQAIDIKHGLAPNQRQKIQIIFQNPDSSLNPRHRVGQLLERPLVLYQQQLDAAARKTEIGRLLDRVRLPQAFVTRYPHELSGGEKQRVAIARAIAAQPAVIVCDEITSGLDVSVQAAIIELLRTIQRETHVALLFITHDLNLLQHIAHRVAVMYLGEIVEQRPVAGLGQPAYHPYTEALLSSVPSVDPALTVRLVRLTGNLPTRSAQTRGCVFASRCPRLIDERCQHERPPQRILQPGHSLVCQLSVQSLRQLEPIWQPTRTDEVPHHDT